MLKGGYDESLLRDYGIEREFSRISKRLGKAKTSCETMWVTYIFSAIWVEYSQDYRNYTYQNGKYGVAWYIECQTTVAAVQSIWVDRKMVQL